MPRRPPVAERRSPRASRRHLAGLVALALALVAVCACRPDRQPGTLVVAVDAPIRDLDPRLATDSPSARLSRLVFEGLTRVDESGAAVLDLAQRISEGPGRDARGRPIEMIVDLRHDVRFHDGSPLDGRDVAWTYQTVMDPTFGTVISGEFRRRFRAVVADPDDPYRVRFLLRRPLATFATDIVLGIAPRALAASPGRRFPGLPIGTGPWRVVAPLLSDRVELVRAPTHQDWQGAARPGPQRLILRTIEDEGARVLSVLGGGADVAMGGLSPAVLQAAAASGRAQIVASPGIAWSYLGLNLRRPGLDDARVRRAIAHAIDRRAIIDTLLGGRARVSEGMMAPGHPAWADLPDLVYDPARSRALLDEAGLHPGPDGVRMRIEIKVSTNRFRRAVGRALARSLAVAGIEATVRSFELGTFLADVRAARFEAFLLLLPEPVEADLLAWMFHSQNVPPVPADPNAPTRYGRLERRAFPPGLWSAAVEADPRCREWREDAIADALRAFALAPLGLAETFGTANRTGYFEPHVDCLLELGRVTLDPAKRAGLYVEAQRQLHDDLPVVPLWFEHQWALVRDGVELPHLAADGRYAVLAQARWRP